MSDEATTIEDKTIRFPGGIPGFPQLERFVLVEVAPDSPFHELRSLDDPDVAMLVTVPWLFFPDYAPEIPEEDRVELGIERPEDATVFTTVSFDPDDENALILNLLGPFVVNVAERVGRQLVLADSDYPARARVELAAT
ncbi:MAG TPA: flagellar assembly protein FliW [Actinobacteria bacterium]|nr:flagellar assembly protein FliW [Actinomycetota bacterium]